MIETITQLRPVVAQRQPGIAWELRLGNERKLPRTTVSNEFFIEKAAWVRRKLLINFMLWFKPERVANPDSLNTGFDSLAKLLRTMVQISL